MKTLTTIFAAIFLVAATGAYAQAPKPPDKVTFKAEKSKDGPVTFDHKAHAKQGCKNCHGEGKPGKITLGEKKAHELCIGCHKEKAKGPGDEKKCDGCHKK
ncbi:MAG TPA: cytochrome c3 family protein [Anaeromyxobacteraceae bacterium]|nr:cytochrome c3 family protein [Anaeromyxobacteraceae bacterium]